MSNIQEQIDFLNDIKNVTEEFEAAYETRKDDPVRWETAKQAFQERRSFWRGVDRAVTPALDESTVNADLVETSITIKGKEVN